MDRTMATIQVLLLAVAASGCGLRLNPEARLRAEIERLGGKVTVDDKSPGKPIIGVDLFGTSVTDKGLGRLKGLARLQSLELKAVPVTDGGMEDLKGLTSLRSLRVSGTKVTDTGLKHLKGLTNLQALNLSSNWWVTDAGL